MHVKFRAWQEILDFSKSLGANYNDVNHLKSIVARWKKTFMDKKQGARRTGEGGKEYQETSSDRLLHDIIYGSKETDTFTVIK